MTKKKTPPSAGLGDTIEKITTKTGIKKAANWFEQATGKDCGCEERRKKLNALIKYRTTINCMTLAQYDRWSSARSEILKEVNRKTVISEPQLKTIYELHRAIFGVPLELPCATCRGSISLWLQMVTQLEDLWKSYTPINQPA